MSWFIEGFDKQTELMIVEFELPEAVTDSDISNALGNPPDIRYAVWPITPAVLDLVASVTGHRINVNEYDYFITYLQNGS